MWLLVTKWTLLNRKWWNKLARGKTRNDAVGLQRLNIRQDPQRIGCFDIFRWRRRIWILHWHKRLHPCPCIFRQCCRKSEGRCNFPPCTFCPLAHICCFCRLGLLGIWIRHWHNRALPGPRTSCFACRRLFQTCIAKGPVLCIQAARLFFLVAANTCPCGAWGYRPSFRRWRINSRPDRGSFPRNSWWSNNPCLFLGSNRPQNEHKCDQIIN